MRCFRSSVFHGREERLLVWTFVLFELQETFTCTSIHKNTTKEILKKAYKVSFQGEEIG